MEEEDFPHLDFTLTEDPVLENYFSEDSNKSLDDSSESSDNDSVNSDTESPSKYEYDAQALNNFIEVDLNVSENLPKQENFPFYSIPVVHVENDGLDILKYFEYFINEEVVELITRETNRNAEKMLQEKTGKYFRGKNWRNIEANELYVFFTIHLLQGLVSKPALEWYWSKKHSIETPFIRTLMTYERYNQIKSFLYFVNEEEFCQETHPCPKLYKVWPIITKINELFRSAMTPEQNLVIDSTLHRGSMAVKPIKATKTGVPIQTYTLCEAKSGYVWSILLYSGKDTIVKYRDQKWLKPTKIVLNLLDPLLDKGYCITTSSFYTSPELAEILINRSTDIYGLVQKGRRDIPAPITRKKSVKKGELLAFQKGKICLMKWCNKQTQDTIILSTVHTPELVETYKKNICSFIPKAISDFYLAMGNIEGEENLTFAFNARRRGRRYYYKVFVHLLDQAAWNSFVLYKKQGGTKNHLQFRLELIDLLVAKYYTPDSSRYFTGRSSATANPMRLVGRHFLEYIPPTPRKEKPTKYCTVCCSARLPNGKRVRRETRYHCPECNVGLCINCFKTYHTVEDYTKK